MAVVTAAATTTTPAATAAAAAAKASHLRKTGVNLLLGFSENSDQVTSLLSV